ncbi:MAG: S41 family peptidase [Intestinibacter sp.]|uniref:S41 family peptidase n=1 Tax=Intestinibacter sp. TaxID=1965304 RepID=UPI002A820045|nr:S41 family peptidase [Intestinibacter sp.]MDY4574977.1 S41 family peptidase [Intestinibacter sp.]
MSKKKLFIGAIIIVIVTVICTNLVQIFLLDGVFISRNLYEKFEKIMALEKIIESDYYQDVDEDKLILGAEKGLVQALEDPYSEYYTEEEFALLKEQTQGSFTGIGIYMTGNDKDNIVVQSVIKNYPAEKSGLKAGDIILKVDGEAVKASESTKASSKIKGKAGTSVVLTIQRGDKTFDVTVKREEIIVESVKSEVKEDNIGYVQITSFDKNTYNEFKEHVSSLQKKNVKSLIIDLRDNPGGLLDVCVDIADYLLGEGTIVYTKDNKGDTQYYKSDADKIDLPIVVLINENSASASEILTAAIVDNKAGIALGTTSYGKGLVQSVKEFKDGTGYKLTTAQYYTPNGDYINKQGIKPDIEEKDKDKQLDKAIEYIKNKK